MIKICTVMQVSSAPLRSRAGAERSRPKFLGLERSGAEQDIFFGVGAERSGAGHFYWCWSGAERSRTLFLVSERSGAEQEIFLGLGVERSGADWSGAELYWKQITGA